MDSRQTLRNHLDHRIHHLAVSSTFSQVISWRVAHDFRKTEGFPFFRFDVLNRLVSRLQRLMAANEIITIG